MSRLRQRRQPHPRSRSRSSNSRAYVSRSLAAVNFFLGCVGITQVARILAYRSSQNKKDLPEAAKEKAAEVKDAAVKS